MILGMAGLLAWVFAYPADTIKTRIQSIPLHLKLKDPPFKGTWDCAVKSYKAEGWRVFCRGFGACAVRAVPVNAVTFYVYEGLMKWLENMK
jgi:solute carrier family 25 carnitine/acylcarnitine transporter 20/29